MTNLQITGGSEKQNAWASKIANDWMDQYDREIANQKIRPETDGMDKYVEILEANRIKLLSGFAKITAKALIDMYVAKRNVVVAMIDQSRKQFKGV